MEQQIKAERANVAATAPAVQAQLIEQYKREMLTQAQRMVPAPAISVPVPAHEKETATEHVERVLERAEPVVEAVEPFAEIALRSGLAAAGASAAAKGIELGVAALEHHIENKRAEQHAQSAPPPPPAPAPSPPPAIDIEINQQVVQNAPAVVAPVVTAPTVTAPAAAVVTAPPVQAVPMPAPPIPVPLPIPPAPVAVSVPLPQPPPAPVMLPPVPVAMPVRPVPASTARETVTFTCPCRRTSRPSCPLHSPRSSCCSSRRPCRPAPCTPQAAAWFAQPAVEAAYAAYTASLAPDGDAMPAYQMPQTVPTSVALADVAYAGQNVTEQDGYYELPAQDYASLEDYLVRNTARGMLELQVRVASDEGAPVPGANVAILKTIAGVTYLFYQGVTDANGSAGLISLPAPDRSLSFAPPQGFVPYAVYTISVAHGDYAPQVFENVTVFPDTEAVQVVRMGMTEAPFVVNEGRYVM